MYLMYVDESGDTGMVRSPTTHFVLSSIVVHETRWLEFINAIRETLKKSENTPMARCKSLIFLDPESAKRNFSVFP